MLEVRARLFIDSSGDLDLMARAGAPFLGLDEGESLQPATMMFRLGPIDFAAFDGMSPQTKAALAARGVAEGAEIGVAELGHPAASTPESSERDFDSRRRHRVLFSPSGPPDRRR